jgi:type I restriction enzyme S subunit
MVKGPGVVTGRYGTLGQVFYVEQDFWPLNTTLYVRDFKGNDPRFISYFLRDIDFLVYSDKAAVPGLNRNHLHQARVRFPSDLTEQRAIAHILGTLDDKIKLNRRMNETLEAMARAVFKAWFVDFDPVRAKLDGRWQRGQSLPGLPMHLYDFFPDRLNNEGIPEGWTWVPASELIEFNPTEALRKGTLAPYLDMASLPTSGSWPEPPLLREFGSGMRFRNGDTLLARITPCLENGKTAFVQCLPDDTVGWGSTEYIVMRPKTPVPAEYAYLLARDDRFREHAIRSMTGTSGRQRAQGDSVAAFKLAEPSDERLWDAFAKQVVPAFLTIKANAMASETLATLRDTLLPKLVSGDLRVPDAGRILEMASKA